VQAGRPSGGVSVARTVAITPAPPGGWDPIDGIRGDLYLAPARVWRWDPSQPARWDLKRLYSGEGRTSFP